MGSQAEFSPGEREELRKMLAAHGAQDAAIKKGTSLPSFSKRIGRVGSYAVYLYCATHVLSDVLGVVLIPADTLEAYAYWKPTAVSACGSLQAGLQDLAVSIGDGGIPEFLDDHPSRHSLPDQQVIALPTGSGAGPVPIYTAVVELISKPSTFVAGATTTTTPAPIASSSGALLEGHSTIRVGGSGTLS